MNIIRRVVSFFMLLSLLVFSADGKPNPQNKHYQPDSLIQASSKIIPIKHGRLEYYRFGTGSPIILVPGFLTDLSSWHTTFLKTLATQHDVIIFNHRGVGRSKVRALKYNSADLAEDIFQLIHTLDLKNPSIVGISMGGMITQHLAVLHENQLGKLILINTAIAGETSVRPDLNTQNLILNMPSSKLGRFLVAERLFFPFPSRLAMAFALIMDRYRPNDYKATNIASIIDAQRNLILAWGDDNKTARQIAKLSLPVLILNGHADKVIPPINSMILKDSLRHSQLYYWPHGGHAMIHQYPKQLADAINEFTKTS